MQSSSSECKHRLPAIGMFFLGSYENEVGFRAQDVGLSIAVPPQLKLQTSDAWVEHEDTLEFCASPRGACSRSQLSFG